MVPRLMLIFLGPWLLSTVTGCAVAPSPYIMELVHWWLLSAWDQGEIHPLILWMQPRLCSVSAPACY